MYSRLTLTKGLHNIQLYYPKCTSLMSFENIYIMWIYHNKRGDTDYRKIQSVALIGFHYMSKWLAKVYSLA